MVYRRKYWLARSPELWHDAADPSNFDHDAWVSAGYRAVPVDRRLNLKAPPNPKLEVLLSDPAVRQSFNEQRKANSRLPLDQRPPIVLTGRDGSIIKLESLPVRDPG